jgi:hypothetical protein
VELPAGAALVALASLGAKVSDMFSPDRTLDVSAG